MIWCFSMNLNLDSSGAAQADSPSSQRGRRLVTGCIEGPELCGRCGRYFSPTSIGPLLSVHGLKSLNSLQNFWIFLAIVGLFKAWCFRSLQNSWHIMASRQTMQFAKVTEYPRCTSSYHQSSVTWCLKGFQRLGRIPRYTMIYPDKVQKGRRYQKMKVMLDFKKGLPRVSKCEKRIFSEVPGHCLDWM